jgi:uncharacterized protein with PIN domain
MASWGGRRFSILGKAAIGPPRTMAIAFSYVLAKATGEPLLFKSDDVGQTDIKTV